MNRNRTLWVAAGVMALILMGCGGGGDGGSVDSQAGSSTPPTPDSGAGGSTATVASPFLGSWKYDSDNYCTDNWPVVPASMQSQKGVAPVGYEFTQSTMSYTHRIYSDSGCTQLEGTVTLIGSISWEAATVSGWSNPVRVISTYTGYEVTGNVTVSEAEAKMEFGVMSKNILGISKNQLFVGDGSSAGADGYPTVFRTRPLAYR